MGNRSGSDSNLLKLPFKKQFTSKALISTIRHWGEYELKQSHHELKEDIQNDQIIQNNLSQEYNRVEQFLIKNNLGDYFPNFKTARIIFSDLRDFLPSANTEQREEIDEILQELIPDLIPRERFKNILKKMFLGNFDTQKEGESVGSYEEEEDLNSPYGSAKSNENVINFEDEYHDSKWYLNKDLIIVGDIISQGSFGVIRRGVLKIGLFKVSVAVKEVFLDRENSMNLIPAKEGEEKKEVDDTKQTLKDDILEEIEIMTELNHKNVCKCFGAFFKYNPKECTNMSFIILELCSKGDLYQFLHRKKSSDSYSFTTKKKSLSINESHLCELYSFFDCERDEDEENERTPESSKKKKKPQLVVDPSTVIRKIVNKMTMLVNIMVQVCESMNYMHRMNISHFDLKSKNILIKGKFPEYRMKLCDFGTSMHIDDFEFNKFVGTIEYMSPQFFNLDEDEYRKNNPGFSEVQFSKFVKSFDVYSFGILLFEVLNMEIPFDELRQKSNSDFDLFRKIVSKNHQPHHFLEGQENLQWCKLDYYFDNLKEDGVVKEFKEKMAFVRKDLDDLMKTCYHPDNKKRPCFDLVNVELNEVAFNMNQDFGEILEEE